MNYQFYRTADGQAGVFFIAFGGFMAVQASQYRMGTASQMGPGYFPLIIGLLLVAIGLAILVRAIFSRNDPLPAFQWKPAIIVTASILLSALVLLKIGLVAAVPALVFGSALASHKPNWLVVALTAAVTTFAAWLIFILGLGLRIPVLVY